MKMILTVKPAVYILKSGKNVKVLVFLYFSPNDVTEGTIDEHTLMIYVSLLRLKVKS